MFWAFYLRYSARGVPVEGAVRFDNALFRGVLVQQSVAPDRRGEGGGLWGRGFRERGLRGRGRPTAQERRQQNKNSPRTIHRRSLVLRRE